MLALLYIMFCGCVGDSSLRLASSIVEKNSLDVNSTVLHKRINESRECNLTGKTVDALASFGILSYVDGEQVIISLDKNGSVSDESGVAFSVLKLYERGYKIEAKKYAMEYISANNATRPMLTTMGKIYEVEGDYRGATLFYLDALNFEPNSLSINYALARLNYLQKKPKLAMKFAKKAASFSSIDNKNIAELIVKIDRLGSEDNFE